MNIYLIRYDRSSRRLLGVREFERTDLAHARQTRLDAELDALRSGRDIEVVLLEAPSLGTLRDTHGSYFFGPADLLARAIAMMQ